MRATPGCGAHVMAHVQIAVYLTYILKVFGVVDGESRPAPPRLAPPIKCTLLHDECVKCAPLSRVGAHTSPACNRAA